MRVISNYTSEWVFQLFKEVLTEHVFVFENPVELEHSECKTTTQHRLHNRCTWSTCYYSRTLIQQKKYNTILFFSVFCWVMNLRPAWVETKVIWTWIFVESELLLRLSTFMQCALLGWVIFTMSRIWNWEINAYLEIEI